MGWLSTRISCVGLAIAVVVTGCGSSSDDDAGSGGDGRGVVLDLGWDGGDGSRRVIVTADDTVVVSDPTSDTGYRRTGIDHSLAEELIAKVRPALVADAPANCDKPSGVTTAVLVTADYQWSLDDVAGDLACRSGLRAAADEVWARVHRGAAGTVYADRVGMWISPAPAGADAGAWPLTTPLANLAVRWNDTRRTAGCAVVPAGEVPGYRKPYVVHPGGSGAPAVSVTFAVLLPGDFACTSDRAAPLSTTISGLAPSDVVIGVGTVSGLGAIRRTLLIKADGTVILDSPTSPTGYVEQRLPAWQVPDLVASAVTVLRTPRHNPQCVVTDGIFYSVSARADQGRWATTANNPGLCGWRELVGLETMLRQQIIENAGSMVEYTPDPALGLPAPGPGR